MSLMNKGVLMKNNGNGGLSIDLSLLSHQNLYEVIKMLKDSPYPALHKKAQKELVRRLKDKGFDNRKICMLLISNVFGTRKRAEIIREWAEAVGISKEEFLKLIGG